MLRFSTLAKPWFSVHDTAMVFPYRPLAWRIVGNAAVIWLGLRFGTGFIGWGLNATVPSAAYMIILTTGLTVLDTRRRSRYLLFENMGVRTLPIGVLAACPPILFESISLTLKFT